MDQTNSSSAVDPDSAKTRHIRGMLLAGAACFLGAGLFLWLREGDRLFAEGLIAAIAGCF